MKLVLLKVQRKVIRVHTIRDLLEESYVLTHFILRLTQK